MDAQRRADLLFDKAQHDYDDEEAIEDEADEYSDAAQDRMDAKADRDYECERDRRAGL